MNKGADGSIPTIESIEELLSDSKYMEAILDSIPGNVYWKDLDGEFRGCNMSTVKFFGLNSKDEVVGKSDYDLLSFEHAERIRRTDVRIMANEKDEILEEVDPKGPENIKHLSHKIPMKNSKGEVIGIAGVSFDIGINEHKDIDEEVGKSKESAKYTEHLRQEFLAQMVEEVTGQRVGKTKSVEAYIKDMRDYLQEIISCMPGHVYWKSRDGKLLGANKNALEYFGLKSLKDLIGKDDYELLDKKTADVVTKIDNQVMETGEPLYNIEEPAFRKKKIIYLTQKVPLFNSAGEVVGLVGISFDITETKEMERKIQEAKEKTQHEKVQAMKSIAASLAHELRTPLLTISNNADIKEFLPELIESYEMAEKEGLPVPFVRPSHITAIKEGLTSIQRETDYANNVITMLLTNLRELEDGTVDNHIFNISEAIDNAISRYPFTSPVQLKMVHWDKEIDFMVQGKSMLVSHIILNLLKNSIYYVEKSGGGDITIKLKKGKKINSLYFTDTGTGIPSSILPHIFDHFFTKNENGTGIGLSFCKMAMQSFGGDIECKSKEGEYTTFVLSFPKITVDQ